MSTKTLNVELFFNMLLQLSLQKFRPLLHRQHLSHDNMVVVVFFSCRANANTQIANSANIRRHELARREEAKDQNKNVA